ncbi:MAG: HAMP domain-containing sensor histidine kinase [Acidimicrobiia bacterium]
MTEPASLLDGAKRGVWVVLEVFAEDAPPPRATVHPVHDAVLGLGRALLQADEAGITAAVDSLRSVLGARSLVIEQLGEAGTLARFESGSSPNATDETGVSISVDGTWAGSVSVGFESDPTLLDRWALDATADLVEGWIRRTRVTAQLSEAVAQKNRFVATVGHEIRTPLAAVLGLAGELRDRFDSLETAEVRELIGVIADQAREIADIVEDLLAFTRTEHFGFVVHTEPTRVDDLVRAAVASVPSAARSGLSMRRIESVLAMCDPLRTRQIIRNLVVNAHRHGGERIFLEVRSMPEGDVVITVADSGGQIPDELAAKMFEPYATSNRMDGAMASLGLGLTVSRQLARKMGGDLFYRWDGESRFELHLPKAVAGTVPDP